MVVKKKRIYEPASKDDGIRLLVDGLWPRGISKAKAHVDLWLREVAPSEALRKWYGHDSGRARVFRQRYLAQLRSGARRASIEKIKSLARRRRVTLVYAARDEALTNADVLIAALREASKGPTRSRVVSDEVVL